MGWLIGFGGSWDKEGPWDLRKEGGKGKDVEGKDEGGKEEASGEEESGEEEEEEDRGEAERGEVVAEEAARERMPCVFWSMTTPTDVKPLCKGMNHAQPLSSVHPQTTISSGLGKERQTSSKAN